MQEHRAGEMSGNLTDNFYLEKFKDSGVKVLFYTFAQLVDTLQISSGNFVPVFYVMGHLRPPGLQLRLEL